MYRDAVLLLDCFFARDISGWGGVGKERETDRQREVYTPLQIC